LLVAAAQPAILHADEALEAAKSRYAEGERNYNAGRYWQSAKSFEEAFSLSRRADLLFNAARAYDRGEYAVRAVEAYQAYLGSAADIPDKDQIQKRVDELRATLCQLQLTTSEKGYLFIDGHEYGRTPMQQPIEMDSGYHRIEVRNGSRSWTKEQQFSPGQTYKMNIELASGEARGQGLADVTAVADEEQRPRSRSRRLAVSFGIGGAIDFLGNNFPPSQATLGFGVDYRVVERGRFGFDFSLRLPVELANSWRNSGFLIGGRFLIAPKPSLPLELFIELDAGLMVLDYTAGALTGAFNTGTVGCFRPSTLTSCTLYGARVHPKLGAAYRFTPAIEARLEVVGVEIDISSTVAPALGGTIPYPRLTFGAAFAYRFL
jgi:hypothetical protein